MLDDYFLWNQPKTCNAEVAEYVTSALDMPVIDVSVPKKGDSSEPIEPLWLRPWGLQVSKKKNMSSLHIRKDSVLCWADPIIIGLVLCLQMKWMVILGLLCVHILC